MNEQNIQNSNEGDAAVPPTNDDPALWSKYLDEAEPMDIPGQEVLESDLEEHEHGSIALEKFTARLTAKMVEHFLDREDSPDGTHDQYLKEAYRDLLADMISKGEDVSEIESSFQLDQVLVSEAQETARYAERKALSIADDLLNGPREVTQERLPKMVFNMIKSEFPGVSYSTLQSEADKASRNAIQRYRPH